MYTYLQIIGKNYPTIQVEATGNGSDYSSLTWVAGDALPDQPTLDIAILHQTQTDVFAQIVIYRDSIRFGGVQVGGNWFQSDDSSRIQMLSLVSLGPNLPAGIQWKTMANSFVTMTSTLALQIFQSIIGKEPAIYAVAEMHRQNMLASSTPDTYNFTTGWPAIFTGA